MAAVCVDRFGFESIRITGGEPTVRAHLPVLVRQLADLGVDLAMTTNGATLSHQAADLAEAGLRRINISCDSLRPDRFAAITRRDALGQVLAGIDAAVAAGLASRQSQLRPRSRRQRRRDPRFRRLWPGSRRGGAVHRVDAA